MHQRFSPKHTESMASQRQVQDGLCNLLLDKSSEAKHGLAKGDIVEVTGNTDKFRRGKVVGFKARKFVHVLYSHDWYPIDVREKVLALDADADTKRRAAEQFLHCKNINSLVKIVLNNNGDEESIPSPFL